MYILKVGRGDRGSSALKYKLYSDRIVFWQKYSECNIITLDRLPRLVFNQIIVRILFIFYFRRVRGVNNNIILCIYYLSLQTSPGRLQTR